MTADPKGVEAHAQGLLMPPLPPSFEQRLNAPARPVSADTMRLPPVTEPNVKAERSRMLSPTVSRTLAAVGFLLSIMLPPIGLLASLIMFSLTRIDGDDGREFASAGVMIGFTLTVIIGLLTCGGMLLVDGVGDLLNSTLNE